MTDGRIDYRVDEGIAWITIANEAKANSLTFSMIQALAACWKDADADDAVRVAVLRGAGGKHFCAGADRSAIHGDGLPFEPGAQHNQTALSLGFSKPVVAMINGAAIGLGMNLAIDCDIRVAVAHAFFADPRTSFGLPPNAALSVASELPAAEVSRLALAGARLEASRAYALGLVSDIAADVDALSRIAGSYAAALAAQPAGAMRANLALLRRLRRSPHVAEVMSAADRRADEVRMLAAEGGPQGAERS